MMAVSVGSPMCCSTPSAVTCTLPSVHSVASRTSASAPSDADCRRSSVWLPTKARVSVMRFCVSVPVLSEQMTDALPSVSTAGRRRMSACFFTIFCTPIAKTMVTMAGSPSGMAATASDTAVMNISRTGIWLKRPMMKMMMQMASAKKPSCLPSCHNLRCSGVAVSSSAPSMAAMRPISVDIPVATTTAVPVP